MPPITLEQVGPIRAEWGKETFLERIPPEKRVAMEVCQDSICNTQYRVNPDIPGSQLQVSFQGEGAVPGNPVYIVQVLGDHYRTQHGVGVGQTLAQAGKVYPKGWVAIENGHLIMIPSKATYIGLVTFENGFPPGFETWFNGLSKAQRYSRVLKKYPRQVIRSMVWYPPQLSQYPDNFVTD